MASNCYCIGSISDAQVANGNLVFCAMGDDVVPGNTYSIPASPTGSAPATHWFFSWIRDVAGAAELDAMAAGNLPAITGTWEDVGLTEATAQAAVDAMEVSVRVRPTDARWKPTEHLADVLSAMGLQRILP